MLKMKKHERGQPWPKRTAAQEASQQRNFRIFKLRGLHAQLNLLTGERREIGQDLVDQELAAMGAKTTMEHSDAQLRAIACRALNAVGAMLEALDHLPAEEAADNVVPLHPLEKKS